MPVVIDPNTNPEYELLAMINSENNTTFTLDDVTFGPPVAVSYEGRNTRIKVSAKENSTLFSERDIYYNRLPLPRLGYMGAFIDGSLTSTQLLTVLSEEKRINILPSEFQPISIPPLEVGEIAKVQLVAKETAIKWLGSTEVELLTGFPPELNTLHTLLHETLPSNNYLVPQL